jgi:hypothetical protein
VAVHDTNSIPGVLAAGPMASVEAIPAHTSFSTFLVIGQGLNATLYDWGTHLLQEHAKVRPSPDASFVLSHLGYWVDNGSPYYHSTAAYNISAGMDCLEFGVKNCVSALMSNLCLNSDLGRNNLSFAIFYTRRTFHFRQLDSRLCIMTPPSPTLLYR